MKKIILTTKFLLCSILYVMAQSSSTIPTGSSEVNYNTGKAIYTYPINSINELGINVPISLQNVMGGIKMEDKGNVVGLGWNVAGIPSITRMKRGAFHDERVSRDHFFVWSDLPGHYNEHFTYGYFEILNNPYLLEYECGDDWSGPCIVDSEPDLFHFNIGGYSGSFFFKNIDGLREIVYLEKTGVKINYNIKYDYGDDLADETDDQKHIIGWQILTPDGNEYLFGNYHAEQFTTDYLEYTNYTKQVLIKKPLYQQPSWESYRVRYVSQWFVNSINNQDNNVQFSYEEEYKYTEIEESDFIRFNKSDKIKYPDFQNNSEYTLYHKSYRLNQIKSKYSQIDLNYDLIRNNVKYVEDESVAPRLLAEIEVSVGIEENMNCLLKYSFNYVYPTEEGSIFRRKYFLDNISSVSCESSNSFTTHFDYFDKELAWLYSENSKDLWGFNNGADNENLEFYPSIGVDGLPFQISTNTSADRAINFEYLRAGTLKEISYANGKVESYDFELNTFYTKTRNIENIVSTTFNVRSECQSCEAISFQMEITFEECKDYQILFNEEANPECNFTDTGGTMIITVNNQSFDILKPLYSKAEILEKLNLTEGNSYTLHFDMNCNLITVPNSSPITSGSTYNVQVLEIPFEHEYKNVDVGGLRIKSSSINDITKSYQYEFNKSFLQETSNRIEGRFCEPCDGLFVDEPANCDSHLAYSEEFFLGCDDEISLNVIAGFRSCNDANLGRVYISFVDELNNDVFSWSVWVTSDNESYNYNFSELKNLGLVTNKKYRIKIYNNDNAVIAARFTADHNINTLEFPEEDIVSSGVLMAVPFNIGLYDINYQSILIDDKCEEGQIFYLNTSATSLFASPLGNEVYYSKIHSYIGSDKTTNGYVEHNFDIDERLISSNYLANTLEPSLPLTATYKRKDHMFIPRDFSLPKSQNTYNSAGDLISSVSYDYLKLFNANYIPYRNFDILCDYTSYYQEDNYTIYSRNVLLTSMTTTEDGIAIKQDYQYLSIDNQNLLSTTTTYNTLFPAEIIVESTQYSIELPEYEFLTAAGWIVPIKDMLNNGLGGGSKTTYELVEDKIRMTSRFTYDSDGDTEATKWIKTSENITFNENGQVTESWSKQDPLNSTFVYEDGLLVRTEYGTRINHFFYDDLRRKRLSIDPTGVGTYIEALDEFHRPLLTKSGIVSDHSDINAVTFIHVKTQVGQNYLISQDADEEINTDLSFPSDAFNLGVHSSAAYIDNYGRNYKKNVFEFTQDQQDYEITSYYDEVGRNQNSCSPGSGGCSLTIFEKSPRSRIEKTRAAGATIFVEYFYGNEVPDIDGVTGYYIKTAIKDENGNVTRSYSNTTGRKKVVIDALEQRTTYLYNDRGQLTSVSTAGGTEYIYDYDGFGRLEYKSIPLKGTYTYGYDSHENLTSETLPNNTILWYNHHHIYNDFLLNVQNGEGDYLQIYTPYHDDLHTSWLGSESIKIIDTDQYLLSEYDYDDYGRVSTSMSEFHDGSFSNYTFHYDDLDNIRSASRVHTPASGAADAFTISTRYEYDRGRRIEEVYKTLPKITDEFLVSRHKYDNRDWQVYKNQGGLFAEVYKYNSRGWLSAINSVANSYPPQYQPCDDDETVACLSHKAPPGGIPNYELDQPNSDLFSLHLNYKEGNNKLQAPSQHNGNISWMEWRVKGEYSQSYGFQYDPINRLEQAKYGSFDLPNCEDKNTGAYNVTIGGYDAMGNITRIARNGLININDDGDAEYGLIDRLNLTYDSGYLSAISEASLPDKGYKQLGDGTGNGVTYEFGNMKSSSQQGITNIDYNYLDLPTRVEKSDGSILEFLYDANGGQLQMTKTTASSSTTTDYFDGIEFVDNNLESIHFEEGRAVYNQTLAGTENNPYLEWSISDHLGNVRVRYVDKDNDGLITVNPNDHIGNEIVGSYHYYPFGMKMEGTWNPQLGNRNKYQYNGIEHIEDFGLSFSNYRIHDPAVGRWLQVDPLAENGYSSTPFNSMWNDPISYSDFNGDTPVHAGAAILGAGYNIYNNWSSIVKNPWSAIGYGLTGAAAGAVSVGNPAAAKYILAGGNIATDIAFGNLPDFNDIGDVAGYGLKLGMDAVAVSGSGAMAKTIKSTLKGVGSDVAMEGAMILSAEKKTELLNEYTLAGMSEVDALTEIANMNFSGSINIVSTQTHYKAIGSSGGAGVLSKVHGNSLSSTRPQHGYEIYDHKSKQVLEIGVSGQELRADGSSPRASQKLKAKYSNNPNARARVVIKDVDSRSKIIKWEKSKVGAHRRFDGKKALPGNKRPSNKSIARFVKKAFRL